MPNDNVNRQFGIGNTNVQLEIFKDDLGIIQEIYDQVLKQSKNVPASSDKLDFLEIEKKIELNITDTNERKRVKELFESIYDRISLIEKTFSDLDSLQQREIHIDICEQYHHLLKDNNQDVSVTLNKLAEHYTPSDKLKNPKYNNLAMMKMKIGLTFLINQK